MPTVNQHLANSEALVRAVNRLTCSITADAYWGDNFYEDWNPIITALTSELLMSCGLAPDTPWYVKRQIYVRHTLEDSMKWLDGKITSDGSFGTDMWDAVRVALFIEKDKLQKYFSSYERLKANILNCVRTNTILAGKSTWIGPGFLAPTVDYLDLLGMVPEADAIIQRIVACQQSDGSWQGNIGPDGIPIVSPVWHTSQVVWTLARRGVSEHRQHINKAIAWLKSIQTAEGYWTGHQQYTIYFTSYAVTALLYAEKPEQQAIALAVDYLKANMTTDGKCADMEGTLMCAFALRQVLGQHFQHDLTVTDYVLSRNNIVRAEAAETLAAESKASLETTRNKLEEVELNYHKLAEKLAGGEIVITKRAAFAICLIGIILSLLVPAFTELVKGWAFHQQNSTNTDTSSAITFLSVPQTTNARPPSLSQNSTNKSP